jgi:hypothetical protein
MVLTCYRVIFGTHIGGFDMPKRQTVAEWLSTHVAVAGKDDCWPAVGGGYNKKGWHVTFKASGGRYLAHRAAYVLANGEIPSGKFVLHKCDNPKCCNPNHLFLGTQSDNAKDMWRKGRSNIKSVPLGTVFGPSPFRKVSQEDFERGVRDYCDGATQKQVAASLGITDVAFGFMLRGKTYPEFQPIAAQAAHLLGRGRKQKELVCE